MDVYKKRTLYKKGQSLIEAVVAIAVVVLIVTGLLIALISTLRSAQSSRSRSTATKLSQDGIETMRNLRNSGWNGFISKAGMWCLGESGELTEPFNCAGILIGGITFTRKVEINDNTGDEATVEVTVNWTEGETVRNSTVTTFLTKWR